jgi:hypothetical protein
MRTKLLCTVGLVAAVIAASAVPAFTADTQSLSLTVTAQPPAAPCVEFATPPGTQVDFGTAPFSTPSVPSQRTGNVAPRFSNCSTATESFLIVGTDATSGGSTWALGEITSPCQPLNTLNLVYSIDTYGYARIGTTSTTLRNLRTGATTFVAGEAHDLGLAITMPCLGSVGGGQTFSLSVTLTAMVA